MTARKRTKVKASEAPRDPQVAETPEIAGEAAVAVFPIVGIGASAGGLAAFEAFFSGMPAHAEPGMAFVLVQHLAPDHKSILTDLIRRYTRMQVFEVEDGMVVQPNCAYIIPPNRDMAFLNGALQLLDPSAPRGQRLPIDFFFRSLAQDQHERAICIVLSGTGSDGTLGVRAIKGEGGMAMAQNPASTEYDGMPRSAIGTGLVDYELPPAEMPAQLIAYVAHAFGKPPRSATAPLPKAENALKKIFVLLRAQTSHDFSQYKPSTIHRRIERRMAVHQIDAMDGYVKYLQNTPAEVEALFRDLLIGVTSFFRDPEAFKTLEEQIIPKLFADKHAGAVIRVWAPGCSTGEEAYSLAILLAEQQEALKRAFQVQIFATDIDSQAIATARTGLYPASIAADITPERLARFFTAEPGGGAYRIHKAIRDLLVFSEQNVIKDPPFSKLDLVSCRNLLIYLGAELQKRLVPLFHYALLPSGFLFLGTSETVGEFSDLFVALDRKFKLYQRKDDSHSAHRAVLGRFLPPLTTLDVTHPRAIGMPAGPGKLPLRELTEQALLLQVAPAGALVNSQGDILYLHGRTGLYLEPAPGETGVANILKMAREGLRRDLTLALRKAVTNEIVRHPGLRVKTNGAFATVNLTVRQLTTGPAATPEAPLYLIVLEEVPAALEPPAEPAGALAGEDGPAATTGADTDARIAALKGELRAKDEYLQTSNEELETSNEELKSSNEEMQSVNEELQSTNEELETSKEELQSVNEELATVNAELQTKVGDLSRANNDMNNLLAGTGIGTVFVDHQLRILRFTPAGTRIINLIMSDIGRPVGHIVSNLVGYDRLVPDVQAVLDTLVPREVDVQTLSGEWYTMRIMPYRTMDNVIEGAVITFVDITVARKTREALRESEEKFATAFQTSPYAITITRPESGTIVEVNDAFISMSGYSRAEVAEESSLSLRLWVDEKDRDEVLSTLREGREVVGKEFLFRKKNGVVFSGSFSAKVTNINNKPCILSTINDITERRRAEDALRRENAFVEALFESVPGMLYVYDDQGTHIRHNRQHEEMTGYSAEELSHLNPLSWYDDKADIARVEAAINDVFATGHGEVEAPMRIKNGEKLLMHFTGSRLIMDGKRYFVGVGTDITERRRAEEALRKANELLRLAVVVRDAHDAMTVQDLEGRIIAWNPGAVRMYGWSEVEALAMNVRDRIPEGLRPDALVKVHQLSQARILEPYHTQRIAKNGTVVEVSMISTALVNEAGQMYAIATTERGVGKS